MGLLQAGIGALSGVLADQWREYFYCDSMPENVLMTKGVKRTGSRNANTDRKSTRLNSSHTDSSRMPSSA